MAKQYYWGVKDASGKRFSDEVDNYATYEAAETAMFETLPYIHGPLLSWVGGIEYPRCEVQFYEQCGDDWQKTRSETLYHRNHQALWVLMGGCGILILAWVLSVVARALGW